ncbi:MAG: hypothetical protein ACRC5H_08415 [Treponemataceae bacterium]
MPHYFENSLQNEWIIITDPYTKVFADTFLEASVASFVRLGEIYKVEGRHIKYDTNKNRLLWYKIKDGWIQETSVKIASNKAKATTIAKEVIRLGK